MGFLSKPVFGEKTLWSFACYHSSKTLLDPSVADHQFVDKRAHEPFEILAILDDHLSKTGKEDANRLDEILYNSFSDLSALHQMRFLVRLHHPRVETISLEEATNTAVGKAWRYQRAEYLNQDHRQQRSLNTENVDEKINAQQKLGNLMGEFLRTEKPKGVSQFHNIQRDLGPSIACPDFQVFRVTF